MEAGVVCSLFTRRVLCIVFSSSLFVDDEISTISSNDYQVGYFIIIPSHRLSVCVYTQNEINNALLYGAVYV